MERISKFEAIALIVVVTSSQIILNLPNDILKQSNSGIFLNTIYITIIAVIFSFIIAKLFKQFENKNILDVSEYIGGKYLRFFIGFLYIIFFMLICSTLVRYFCHSLKLIYFDKSPIIFLMLFFFVPVATINKLGFKSVSRVNLIFVPLLLISILVIAISVLDDIHIENIFPILGHGVDKTFITGLANISSFSSIGYLYFLPPLLKNTSDFKKISITSTLICGLYLILTSIFLFMVFPYIAQTDEMLSSYLITRTIRYGDFFQRVDAIFIFVWIISTLCYISVTTFYILNILKGITKIKKERELTYSIILIMLGLSLIIRNVSDVKFIYQYIYKYSVLILMFGISFLILIFANIKKKKQMGNKV